jgi:diacylglycerol diphosphate phosphatase/phosphatidate phosphatase
MADIQLGVHTIRSHGSTVARFHMYDWIILVLLAVTDGLLNIIEPFHRFVGKDMMTDLRYPLNGNTVPFWAVPVGYYCLFLCVVMYLSYQIRTILYVDHDLVCNDATTTWYIFHILIGVI